jgi:chemotaxis protein MotB
MARMPKWLALAALAFSLTGCVSEEKYTAMKLRADQLAAQSSQAESDANAARAQADAYKAQIDGIGNTATLNGSMVQNLNSQNADLKAQVAAWQAKYEAALSAPPQVIVNGGTALPAQLSNALSEFAAANPDIVDFDAARGVVKFKSDVTFASGKTDLSAKAVDAVRRFSQILNSQGANEYELMVAGHTDNQRVTRQETIQEGNFDNWYLSSHRAISVAAELVKNGVSKARLGIAGYADQRPIASNATEAGRSQNRRVEILILPTTARSMPSGGGAISASHRVAPTADTHRYNKDESTSTFNK